MFDLISHVEPRSYDNHLSPYSDVAGAVKAAARHLHGGASPQRAPHESPSSPNAISSAKRRVGNCEANRGGVPEVRSVSASGLDEGPIRRGVLPPVGNSRRSSVPPPVKSSYPDPALATDAPAHIQEIGRQHGPIMGAATLSPGVHSVHGGGGRQRRLCWVLQVANGEATTTARSIMGARAKPTRTRSRRERGIPGVRCAMNARWRWMVLRGAHQSVTLTQRARVVV